MKKNTKGFTLIEMLVVIAIIAILVSMIIPTLTSSTGRASAATDAANLRSMLGMLNSVLITKHQTIDEAIANYDAPACKLHPGSQMKVLYTVPGIIDVYYVDGSNYYGLDYLSDYAQNGSSSVSTAAPSTNAGDTWYDVGTAS